MQDLNSYQDLNTYQGVSPEDEVIPEHLREETTPENQLPVKATRDKDGELEPVYEESSGPKNAQETLGKAPQPEQSQEDKDKDYQASLITEAADWAAEKLLGRSKEESQAARKGGQAEQAQTQEKLDNSFAGDAVKAVTSGVEKAAQDAIGFANFAGDFAKTKLGMVEEDDVWNNTDHKDYIGSQRDLIMAEPRSQAGQFARDMVSFVVMQRQLGAATGLNKAVAGKGLINPQRLAAETALGAVADFIIDPGDGNASNALQEFFPSLKDNDMISAFAHADDDDEFTRRLKNTVEGGVMGVAVDAVGVGLKGLLNGASKIADWLKSHPGKKAVDAPAEIKAEAVEALTDAIKASDDRPRLVLKQTEMTKVEQTLPNGEAVNWYYAPEEIMGGEVTHYDVSWDMASREGKIGTGGKAMVTEFRKQVKDLEPGTVISAQPLADDELGSGFIKRSAAQERAMAKNKAADDAARLKQAEDLWIEENADQFPMEFADGTGYATAKEAWDDLDDAAKDTRLERFETEGKIEKGHETGVSNVRGNVYTRMGFGNVDPYHGTQFGVVQADGSIKPIDLTLKSENRVEELAAVKKAIDEARADAPEGSRPGYTERVAEDYANGGTKSRQDYEPYERAGKTAEFPMEKVLKEQAQDTNSVPFTPGGPSPRLTDNTVRQIAEAGGDVDIVKRAVDELEESLSPRLRANDPAVVEEAQKQLAKLVKDNLGEEVDMSALTEIKGEGGDAAAYIQQLLGNVVAKSYMKDLSVQMRDLASQAKEITATGVDGNRQYNLLLDRLKASAALQMRDASRRGGALKTLQNSIAGGSEAAAKQKIDNFNTKVEELRTKLNEGDPDAAESMNVLAESLVLADGNAELALSFGQKWAKMVKEDFTVTLYNSYLSGINTQGRNILGNVSNVLMKPAQIAMGATKEGQRRSALAMYANFLGDFAEGFQVARTAFMDNTSTRSLEGTWQGMDMAQKLDNLRATAKTPMENAMYNFKAAQYHFMANPWLQGATRMLSATDDGFKVMSARQKARFDAVMLAIEDGIDFDPKKFETVWSTKYKNGEIVDEDLLNWAKQDTFQEDLNGNMAMFADAVNDSILLKFIVPFVKTPTNILKQTGHYVPLGGTAVRTVNRALDGAGLDFRFFKEYDKVMNGADETMKAVYRGREATGVMVVTFGGIMGAAGLITGSGPRDPDKRKAWEEAGNQAHSIKLGGVWVSTRFLGPLGILLSASADLGMVGATAGAYDNFQELQQQLIYTTAGALMEQSWLKGLANTLTATMEAVNGRREMNWEDSVAQITRALVPYQAALRSLNNTLVPGVRDYNNSMDKFWAETVPGLKAFMGHERISLRSGEPVYNQGMTALNQVVPFGLKETNEDPVLGRLVELGVDFPMEMVEKYKGEELTAVDQNKLNRYFSKTGVWENLEGKIFSESFQKQYDSWKEDANRPRKEAEWYKDIASELSQARTAAINVYRNENTPEGVAFDQLIERIDMRKHFDSIGEYGAAAGQQELIDLAN